MLRKIPQGKLLIIGGGEDKGRGEQPLISRITRAYEPHEILSVLVPRRKNSGNIEIITTASSEPDQISKEYKRAFLEIGYKRVKFINMGNNYDARNPEFTKRIKKAHAVLFSGGDQFRLSTILGNTDVLEVIKERYLEDPDFLVAGTSAGATAAGVLMMYEGENNEALLKGAVKISSGLGFVDGCIIDTHFVKRGRFGRLAEAIVMNPTCIGIGLGEDTALLITKGNEAKCLGSGMVIIIDGKDVGHTNIAYANVNSPLCIENLRVHVLCKNSGFLLNERKFVPSREDIMTENKLR